MNVYLIAANLSKRVKKLNMISKSSTESISIVTILMSCFVLGYFFNLKSIKRTIFNNIKLLFDFINF